MYLATFELQSWPLYQACCSLPPLPPVADQLRDTWWQRYARQISLVRSTAEGQWALRVTLDQAGRLHRVFVATSPHEARLRKGLAAFTALEGVIAGSISIPMERAEHDILLDQFPAWQCRIEGNGYRLPPVWFACDFRVAPFLDKLLSEADALGYRFGYQLHVCQTAVHRADVAAARKNALQLRGHPGVNGELLELQDRLAMNLATATASVEEYVGTETPAAAAWLQSALRREFQHAYGRLGFQSPSFEPRANEYDDLLAVALHSNAFAEYQLDEICGAAVDDASAAKLLAWRPADDLAARCAQRLAPPLPPIVISTPNLTPVTPLVEVELPAPYTGSEPFVFISYKRGDEPRFAPILHQMIALGFNLWYDRGIPGGSEWDATLEERITHCHFVLLFVSESAINSKYVRREVKFADALNKPILSVVLEETRLSGGMNMLLTQYQMLNGGSPDFERQLRDAAQFITRLADQSSSELGGY